MPCSACLLIVLVRRRAKEAAAASEREAAAAAEEAERASWQAEHAESEGMEDEQTQALRRAASKWTKRCFLCILTMQGSVALEAVNAINGGLRCLPLIVNAACNAALLSASRGPVLQRMVLCCCYQKIMVLDR